MHLYFKICYFWKIGLFLVVDLSFAVDMWIGCIYFEIGDLVGIDKELKHG